MCNVEVSEHSGIANMGIVSYGVNNRLLYKIETALKVKNNGSQLCENLGC